MQSRVLPRVHFPVRLAHSHQSPNTVCRPVAAGRGVKLCEAPATSPAGINPVNYSREPAKNVPMIIVQGDMDTLVPVEGTRRWIDKMKQLNMTYQYAEVPGGDHGSVLTTGARDIFAFFAKHTKAAR
jgi:alpha-beta hydrolase superfamily lysophospholipase